MEPLAPHDLDWWNRHETRVREGARIRFDVFVRTLGGPPGAHGRQSAILEWVDDLEEGGAVDTANVVVWGDRVCVSECCASRTAVRALRDRVESLRDWSQAQTSVTSRFERREIHSSITDEHFEVVDLPTVCLAVSANSSLAGVYPAAIDGVDVPIETYLTWFERARRAADRPVLDA